MEKLEWADEDGGVARIEAGVGAAGGRLHLELQAGGQVRWEVEEAADRIAVARRGERKAQDATLVAHGDGVQQQGRPLGDAGVERWRVVLGDGMFAGEGGVEPGGQVFHVRMYVIVPNGYDDGPCRCIRLNDLFSESICLFSG